nr:MAG TPA: hypothetical protein [Caudoviricetes sp.]
MLFRSLSAVCSFWASHFSFASLSYSTFKHIIIEF